MAIIKSFLDTDWYKITMGQVVNRQFPHAQVKYDFINRGKTKFPPGFADRFGEELLELCKVKITAAEVAWLKANVRYIKPTYLDWLSTYTFDPTEVTFGQTDGNFYLSVAGPWYRTVFWEVPLLALVSELYYKTMGLEPEGGYGSRIAEKADTFEREGMVWADFGTRRRFSATVQDDVVRIMSSRAGFVGTSNPYLAMKCSTRPIGTYAHECVMAMQVLYGFSNCNRGWMEAWVKEYEGDLGIALPDTVTSDFFFRQQFSMFYAKLFDGVRQDSGDPNLFAKRAVEHYKSVSVDPRTKQVVFSDGLTTAKAVELHRRWKDAVLPRFGVGTHFTNDCGHPPVSFVMKMTHANFGWGMVPVVKLSDDAGKYTGDAARISVAKSELRIA